MNETLLFIIPFIISIVIAVLSFFLGRPPKKYRSSTEKVGRSVIAAIVFLMLLFSIIGGFELRIFNGSAITAIIAFLLNILIGNSYVSTTLAKTIKRKNFLMSFCVFVIFLILTIVLNVQFSKLV